MEFRTGLTTWVVQTGTVALIWRWNMPLREATRTWRVSPTCRRQRGYVAAGPLIVSW